MRLCHKCRVSIGNRDLTCPQCGAIQDDGPRVNTGQELPPGRGIWSQLVSDLTGFHFTLRSTALLVLPLVVCGLIGYSIDGGRGALIGALAGMILVIAMKSWLESRG
jgi:hypothetical protein